jgi:hypothetical protein
MEAQERQETMMDVVLWAALPTGKHGPVLTLADRSGKPLGQTRETATENWWLDFKLDAVFVKSGVVIEGIPVLCSAQIARVVAGTHPSGKGDGFRLPVLALLMEQNFAARLQTQKDRDELARDLGQMGWTKESK